MSLQSVARAGATLLGRMVALDGETIRFDDSVAANVSYGDQFAARLCSLVDAHIGARGLSAPDPEPDFAGRVAPAEPIEALRLDGLGSVIWCTGYRGDFSWLGPGLLDARGAPLHRGTAAPAPGIWFVGLRWLTRRCSGNFLGFPADAATVADSLYAQLAPRERGVVSASSGGASRMSRRSHSSARGELG